MATDVFGRPLNEEPSFPVNRHPLAPNPLDPGPQTDPFSGIRGPGDLGTERASSAEFMGAVYGIQAARPGLQEDDSLNWPQGSPGGHTMPTAVPHVPVSTGYTAQRIAEE